MRKDFVYCDQCEKECIDEYITVDFHFFSETGGSLYYGPKPEGLSDDAMPHAIMAASNRRNWLGKHDFCSIECHNKFFESPK